MGGAHKLPHASLVEILGNAEYVMLSRANGCAHDNGAPRWMALNYDIRRESHAIGEFSATINFASAVSATTFAKVLAVLKPIADELELPAPVNIQTFNIAIGNPTVQPPQALNGAGFQRFAKTGEVACALVCDSDSITYTLREYDRWKDVISVLVEKISQLAAIYVSEVPAVRNFLLQYVNEFRATTPYIQSADELFRSGNRWLAPLALKNDRPWHCHVGEFLDAADDYRNLVNLNFDVSPQSAIQGEAPRNYVRVLILAANQYDLPSKGALVTNADAIAGEIQRNFNAAHALEKRILNEIISDDYIAIMGDGANEH